MRCTLSVLAGIAAAFFVTGIATDGRPAAQQSKSQWDGIYTAEQATRGEALYNDQCASCHGVELNGGDRAPALAGDEFGFNWDGATLRELFELTSFSMPQDDPGSLSPQQNADILAYILDRGEYPAGQAELPTDLEVLDVMRLIATKP